MLVPPWLQGVWSRDWIRRAAEPGGELGPKDDSVEVLYVQTPWAFIDIRRPLPAAADGVPGVLAFGGVASVAAPRSDDAAKVHGIVSWHACLNLEPPEADPAGAWMAADSGKPRATEDIGIFSLEDSESDAWIEEDPQRTLQERWVRLSSGCGRFLALRHGTSLLVLADSHFAFAQDDRSFDPLGETMYVAGKVCSGAWTVVLSAGDRTLEGSELHLPGSAAEWHVLPGSTITPPVEDSGLPPLPFKLVSPGGSEFATESAPLSATEAAT